MARMKTKVPNPDGGTEYLNLSLTAPEKAELKRKKQINEALVMIVESSRTLPEIAKELDLSLTILHDYARSDEFPAYREAVATRAAGMYLDLDKSYKTSEIAANLGMSVRQLRAFVRTPAFIDKYRELLAKMEEDPTPRAAQLKLVEEGVPKAYQAMMDLLDPITPAQVRLNAAKHILELAGIKGIPPAENDRNEAARFLTNVTTNYNVVVPADYLAAVERFVPQASRVKADLEPDAGDPDSSESSVIDGQFSIRLSDTENSTPESSLVQ